MIILAALGAFAIIVASSLPLIADLSGTAVYGTNVGCDRTSRVGCGLTGLAFGIFALGVLVRLGFE